MKRRGFLGLLGAIPSAVVTKALPIPDSLRPPVPLKALEQYSGVACSSSVPAFSFSGDTDTGMYRSSADMIGISVYRSAHEGK